MRQEQREAEAQVGGDREALVLVLVPVVWFLLWRVFSVLLFLFLFMCCHYWDMKVGGECESVSECVRFEWGKSEDTGSFLVGFFF